MTMSFSLEQRGRWASAAAQRWRNGFVLAMGDVGALAIALLAGRALIAALSGGPFLPRYTLLLLPAWCIGAAAAGLLPTWGLDAVEEMRRVQLLLLAIFAGGGLAYFFGPSIFYPSRLAYVVSWAAAAVLLPATRAIVRGLLRRAKVWGCPAVIYGDRATIETVAESFRRSPAVGYLPVGAFTDEAPPGARIAGLPVLGGLLDSDARAEIAVAPMLMAEQPELAERYDRTLAAYRHVLLLPDLRESVFLWVRPRALGDLLGMEVAVNLLNPMARAIKRGFDLALSLLFLPIWLPLFALIALSILILDRHAPFFLQERVGRNGRRFRLLKFRTMAPDAEKRLREALERDPALRAAWERDHKLPDDPRVTPWGRRLRRWSLDELPQLFHVLSGRMSLVGPRPLPPDHFAGLRETTRLLRNRVRPGMTGLWQVSGRGDSGTAGMDRWDAAYVRNWSVWLDIVVLLRTVRAVLTGRGAY